MKLKDLSENHQRVIVSALLSFWASGDFGDVIEEHTDTETIDLLTAHRSFIATADGNLLEDTLKKALADTKID